MARGSQEQFSPRTWWQALDSSMTGFHDWETATFKKGLPMWLVNSDNTNMREVKVENEEKHYIKTLRNQCEGDWLRIANSKATRNVRTEALTETPVDDLRKKHFTVLMSDLNRDFCRPSLKCVVLRTERKMQPVWH